MQLKLEREGNLALVKREWVGLTDEEIKQCVDSRGGFVEDFARVIETKLKEKNA